MKKFLLVLLIALVASATIQFDTGDLNGGILDWFKKIGQFIASLWGKLKDLYDWLKENGLWDQVLSLAKEYGKPKAVELCASYFWDEDTCSGLIDLLLSFIS